MSGLMLLTSNHTSHNDCWIFNCGHQGIVFCVACALEQLEDPGKPPVKKKFLLTELLKVVVDSDHELLRTLDDEPQVSVHLVSVLIALFASSDDGIIASAIEVIVEVCCQLRNEDLVYGLVNQVTSLCLQDSSFQKSLPSLTLIGRLLQSIPPLADLLQQSYRHFTDYLLTGLKYPEENIQSAITYILLHLAGGHMSNICKEPLVKELIKNLLAIIASASSSELTMNSLGLLKKVVENECSVHEIMATDNYGLASSAFKKVLLSRNGIHQITVVQCLTQLVLAEKSLKQTTFTESLLSADIAEFLFECLATTNDILLR
ncbi:meiosis inhibitor protein 1-like [Antedon mediterranea]|uniref:meiosis inhibitor protein 1-like n=1 Tax=Antedon mediterranea TaxID=105859 RepID=UPI003AF88436